LKKRLLQTSLIAITLGLIVSLSIMGVFEPNFSTVANADVTSESEWRLIVNGPNNNCLNLSLSDLAAMPKSTVYAVLSCYGLIVADGNWGGVNLGLLLNMTGVEENTASIQFRAADGYTVTLPLEDAMQENVIIAYEINDQPLPEGLRLVVPWANGNVWISKITSISQTNAILSGSQLPTPISPPMPEYTIPRQQSPTPEPRNQSTTSPVIPPSNNQPQPEPQQDSPGSILPKEYSYLIVSAIVAATAAATGYLFYKRRKTPNLFSHKLSTT
jgi:DMSO/TMAO reductase YedYZ molybdopterin-dependent catalytic subunit